jgi:hypothetical protein
MFNKYVKNLEALLEIDRPVTSCQASWLRVYQFSDEFKHFMSITLLFILHFLLIFLQHYVLILEGSQFWKQTQF